MNINQNTVIQETLSEQEEQFEKWRNTIGLFLGPFVAVIIYFMEMPQLSHQAHLLAAILGWTVVWWICEPIPLGMTALASSVLCVVLGVEAAKRCLHPTQTRSSIFFWAVSCLPKPWPFIASTNGLPTPSCHRNWWETARAASSGRSD